ncbi:leucine-rich repeat domain-containing protein [Pseudomonas rubra]|uniref:Leucine-rich repeat domain-containing protein n=1 Tax=Pseudomonas rubra TaxID=2942627 RepID=A0ABT5PEQ9_9PSED|nr:leucine-rich repeat domain-containing protein [Pseudomonas rubra]MDD1016429.1 leucine-rich repeat domain-containing protein [Pseudomonas rubra]MDD1036558.1 leucine-rich repeat domain-containing protein [Pseudomonas rubra]MDD1156530.1 leucine-rich repeat domain-containing protein [Pseudomonas rubra]
MTDTLPSARIQQAFDLKRQLPDWISHSSPEAIEALHRYQLPPAASPSATDPLLVKTLQDSRLHSQASMRVAARLLKPLKGITEFAEPLLVAEIEKRFKQRISVTENELVHLRDDAGLREDRLDAVLISRQTLLQAALQNFTELEATLFRFDHYSKLAPRGALQPFPESAEPGRFASQSIRWSSTLSITPHAFALMCRELDIGKQYAAHLAAVYQASTSQVSLQQAWVAAARDYMAVKVHEARIARHLSEPAYRMLGALIEQSHSASPTQPVQVDKVPGLIKSGFDGARCYWLDVFGTTLGGGFMVISPEPVNASVEVPLVVYMPGADTPVQQFDSYAEFNVHLQERLQDKDFRRYFSQFFSRRTQAQVFAKLLSAEQWRAQPPQLVEVRREVFNLLFEASVDRAKDDARVLAVPTEAVDREAWLADLEHYRDLGLSMLNVAAFFVPGLGEVLMVSQGAQLVGDIFHGIHAWEDGDRREALEHLKSVGVNLAIAAGLGVVGTRVATALNPPALVESLVPIELAQGPRRLWQPDLASYRQDIELPSELAPNAEGQYRVDNKQYIRVGEGVFEQYRPQPSQPWRLKDPHERGYEPPLAHNGQGAWRLLDEQPLNWSRRQLLRRLGHRTSGLSDEQLEQALQISGVEESRLRQLHVDNQPLPTLLADSLERMKLEAQVRQLVLATENGSPITRRMAFAPSVAPSLAGWPAGRSLEVYEGPALSGEKVARYPGRGPDTRNPIKVQIADLTSGNLVEVLLKQLTPAEIDVLLGGAVEPGARVAMLRTLLAKEVERSSRSIFDSLYSSMAQTKANAELLLARAYEGLYLPRLASTESDRLLLACLQRLDGWSARVSLVLRGDTLSGPVLGQVGLAGVKIRRVLVKEAGGYRAYEGNSALHSLSATRAENSLYNAVLHALPDAQREALGLGIHEHVALRERVLTLASANREHAANWLYGPQAHRAQAPQGRLLGGGNLQGRVAAYLPAPLRESYAYRQHRSLFPAMSEQARQAEFSAWDAAGIVPIERINALQAEYSKLDADLSGWAASESLRAKVAERVRLAWQRVVVLEDEVGIAPMLDLSGFGLYDSNFSDFPLLEASFDHVRGIDLEGNNLTELPSRLISRFKKLRMLSASANDLTVMPLLVEPSELTFIDLSNNRIELTAAGQNWLNSCTRLKVMGLSGNPLGETLDLSRLPALQTLGLSGCELVSLPAGLLRLTDLQGAALSNNRIAQLPESLLDMPADLGRALDLRENPLDEQAQALVESYYDSTGVDLQAAAGDNPLAFTDEQALLRWRQLRTSGSRAFFSELASLSETDGFLVAAATLRRRVDEVLLWLQQANTPRAEIFAERNPQFSAIERRMRVATLKAQRPLAEHNRELLQLVTGWSRQVFAEDYIEQVVLHDYTRSADYPLTFEVLLQSGLSSASTDESLLMVEAPRYPDEPIDIRLADPAAYDLMGARVEAFVEALRAEDAGSPQGLSAIIGNDHWIRHLRTLDPRFAKWDSELEVLDEQVLDEEINEGQYKERAEAIQQQFMALKESLTQQIFQQSRQP